MYCILMHSIQNVIQVITFKWLIKKIWNQRKILNEKHLKILLNFVTQCYLKVLFGTMCNAIVSRVVYLLIYSTTIKGVKKKFFNICLLFYFLFFYLDIFFFNMEVRNYYFLNTFLSSLSFHLNLIHSSIHSFTFLHILLLLFLLDSHWFCLHEFFLSTVFYCSYVDVNSACLLSLQELFHQYLKGKKNYNPFSVNYYLLYKYMRSFIDITKKRIKTIFFFAFIYMYYILR